MTYKHEDALKAIVELSAWAGDPARDLVVLAEGNTSIKVGESLLVKASGASMVSPNTDDFVEVDRGILQRFVTDGDADDAGVSDALRAATTWGTRKPSVETLLHIVCQAYHDVHAVVHTHPTAVNALLCSSEAGALVTGSYFPDQIVTLGHNPLLIPYMDPGLPLAHAAKTLVADHAQATGALPKVIYLRNHGMFALGSSPTEAKQITEMAVKSARVIGGALSVGRPTRLSDEHAARIHTRPDELFRRKQLAANNEAR